MELKNLNGITPLDFMSFPCKRKPKEKRGVTEACWASFGALETAGSKLWGVLLLHGGEARSTHSSQSQEREE